MPDPALPVPRPEPLPGTHLLTRRYADALGRPMDGKVTFTPAQGSRVGDVNVLTAPVTVTVTGGLLRAMLPADTYEASGRLINPDGAATPVQFTVTLPSEA